VAEEEMFGKTIAKPVTSVLFPYQFVIIIPKYQYVDETNLVLILSLVKQEILQKL
jgi:hypothetical protein